MASSRRVAPLRRTVALLAAAGLALGGLAACGGDDASDTSGAASDELQGLVREDPIQVGDVTVPEVAVDGSSEPFRFVADPGELLFVYFGYTNCPDVCPVHVANVAAVLHKLPFEDQRKARFVFVTADPARDSLPRLRQWLDQFDASFVGLRGDEAEIARIMSAVGMPPAIRGAVGADGRYEVGHPAAVLVFTADDSAHVLYPFGTRQLDWAEDIPRLLRVRPQTEN